MERKLNLREKNKTMAPLFPAWGKPPYCLYLSVSLFTLGYLETNNVEASGYLKKMDKLIGSLTYHVRSFVYLEKVYKKMKIGQNIKDLRLKSDYTTKFMAVEVGITEEEYIGIENDGDVTLNLLEAIANRLSTTVVDIIELRDATAGVRNFFNNNNGNQGTIINIQGINQEEIRKAYKELYSSELKRVPLLEALLHQHNIKFDF